MKKIFKGKTVRNDMINKNVKDLFPYFPISLSLNKKLRRFRILSWIIGGSAGSTQPSPGRATLSFRSCQNPQSGMTFMKQPAFTLVEGGTHVDLPPTKVKFAFTLAEVLITLGIIGIVAAMTIPTLITNHQKKQTVVKLQKAISVLNQAYRLAYDDVGEVSIEDASSMMAKDYFDKYWAPYLKTSLYCTDYSVCGYSSNTPLTFRNGTRDPGSLVYPLARTTFYTPDGFLYVIMTSITSNDEFIPSGMVRVDINGAAPPNMYGKDVFQLIRKTDGEKGGLVLPECSQYSDSQVNTNCSDRGYGTCCAEKIKRAGWRIDDSYPW